MKLLVHLLFAFLFSTSLIINSDVLAQEHPFSKQDSSRVKKYLSKYQNQKKYKRRAQDAANTLNQVAFIYWEHNMYEPAITYYKESLIINEQLENEQTIAIVNNNLGLLYGNLFDFDTSYDYLIRSLAAMRSMGDEEGMISTLMNLSVILNNLSRYDESIDQINEALAFARKNQDIEQIKNCYGILSETHEKAGNAKQSIYYFNLYKTFTQMSQDEIINQLMEDITEEKTLKGELQVENKKYLSALQAKQKEIKVAQQKNKAFDQRLNDYDSINNALYADINRKELRLELLQNLAKVKQLENERNLQFERMEKDKERNFNQIILLLLFALIVISGIIFSNSLKRKKTAKKLIAQNNEIIYQKAELAFFNEHLQEKIDESTKTLMQSNQKMSDLIYSNNHNIRRPLANIMALIEIISENEKDPVEPELFESLLQSAEQLDDALSIFDQGFMSNIEMLTNFLPKDDQT
ncbi:MAG: tetratricopeptide repeat protein [Reichenbachiella sp.]